MHKPLSDPRIFESRLICVNCRKGLAKSDEPTENDCRCYDETGKLTDFIPEPSDHFLDDAGDVKPIHLKRIPVSNGGFSKALVDIPHTIVYHSPDGFEWGYGGSGPNELALNILALFVPLPEAWRLHQRFTSDVIAHIGTDGSTLEPPDVRLWIETFWDREQREG